MKRERGRRDGRRDGGRYGGGGRRRLAKAPLLFPEENKRGDDERWRERGERGDGDGPLKPRERAVTAKVSSPRIPPASHSRALVGGKLLLNVCPSPVCEIRPACCRRLCALSLLLFDVARREQFFCWRRRDAAAALSDVARRASRLRPGAVVRGARYRAGREGSGGRGGARRLHCAPPLGTEIGSGLWVTSMIRCLLIP